MSILQHTDMSATAGLLDEVVSLDTTSPVLQFDLPKFNFESSGDNLFSSSVGASQDSSLFAAAQDIGQLVALSVPGFAPVGGDGSFDAKGGAGTHGGGGGGGGGGGTGNLLTTYTSGSLAVDDSQEFNVQIDFSGSWTEAQQSVVTWAADFISSIITADVRDDTDLNGNPVDDVVISVSTGRIDGHGSPLFGNVLAQTTISAVRDPGTVQEWLPVTSSIELDSTDLKDSSLSDTWDAIILHEMVHAIGFAGVIFDNLNLVDANGNFSGANAVAAYGTGTAVPIEAGGGSGTAGSHWDEATFAPDGQQMSDELMTGYIAAGERTLLSDTTVAALADLGYVVTDPSTGSTYLAIDSGILVV